MKKIAIIGAGISGLFLANLLEKDKSNSYKIFLPIHWFLYSGKTAMCKISNSLIF